ncbi:MAG: isoprenylcysteine carboxylmethyltransferase family protein [Deltaproteobacteria bacterium]|nr:isoprenylcysteine carboxylmethyltransferase family protein [Deltaproteobacteria bacterium]
MVDSADLKRYRKREFVRIPLRIIIGLLLFSLPAGGPQELYSVLPGQVFGIIFILQIVMERIIQAPDIGGRKLDQGSFVVGWLGHAVTFLVTVGDYFHFHSIKWSMAWLVAGIILVIIGQTIRIAAIRTLGRFFTPTVRVHSGHKVVKNGPYAYVRHPSYTGLLLLNLGYVTMFASIFGYVAFILFNVPAIINRIQVEEKALVRKLGNDYKAYRRHVKRLIPYLY